mmetsp:Transcript_68513/g.173302  ORF Transcript_68513/g.173302 Transcript_68513/m.173302 type:complete len:308 (+) Transcript_68513:890-1813(+)
MPSRLSAGRSAHAAACSFAGPASADIEKPRPACRRAARRSDATSANNARRQKLFVAGDARPSGRTYPRSSANFTAPSALRGAASQKVSTSLALASRASISTAKRRRSGQKTALLMTKATSAGCGDSTRGAPVAGSVKLATAVRASMTCSSLATAVSPTAPALRAAAPSPSAAPPSFFAANRAAAAFLRSSICFWNSLVLLSSEAFLFSAAAPPAGAFSVYFNSTHCRKNDSGKQTVSFISGWFKGSICACAPAHSDLCTAISVASTSAFSSLHTLTNRKLTKKFFTLPQHACTLSWLQLAFHTVISL